jgi:hypothetical protein
MSETNLYQDDIKNVSKTIYRERRKRHPTLPKSRNDVHLALSSMSIETSKSEKFLQLNDIDNGVVIFSSYINLKCLCDVDDVFMDGTFKCCPKFYTLHGYKKGNYVPLVFILLPGKSEVVYQYAFSSLIRICREKGLEFSPSTVHVDFEETVMKVVKSLLPTVTVKCCRFQLGQSWWRKIQSLGLSNEYKDKESDIGKWLLMTFGLHFVSGDSIEDIFAEVIMSEAPSDSRCTSYADYLTVNLWAEPPSDVRRTTNGAESFHSHFNAQFYFCLPSIFAYLDVIMHIQTVNYIKIRHISETSVQSRTEREKIAYITTDLWTKLQSGNIHVDKYLKSVGYKNQAKTDI